MGKVLEEKIKSKIIPGSINMNDPGQPSGIVGLAGKQYIGENGYWIYYDQNEVIVGKGVKYLSKKKGISNKDILKEIRYFSEKGELHIWKYKGMFKYRIRVDDSGDNTNIYDEEHFRWSIKEQNGGLKNIILKIDKDSLTDEKLPKKFIVRNYFEYNEDGTIRFIDARLCGFEE